MNTSITGTCNNGYCGKARKKDAALLGKYTGIIINIKRVIHPLRFFYPV